MSSPTLKMIMEHWPDFPKDEAGFVELPFDVEAFCRENDDTLEALNKVYEAAKIFRNGTDAGPPNADMRVALDMAIEELEGKG